MASIRQLPASVVNKIAAGEVIERPSSVIKELLENALDAGSTRIDVAIERGGLDLLRVADNGGGIAAEELRLAVAPHATSKLANADDLFRVATMGFRGEALASIAEISRLVLRSRPPAAEGAAELRVDGGEVVGPVPAAGPPGTLIEVRDLFFNTPVRRKYLRSIQTELGHVSEAVTRVALAWPEVHFTLRHNERTVYDLPPADPWRARIAQLFGQELAESLLWVESQDEQVRLYGYVAHPSVSRGNQRAQYLFLNRRMIRDKSLSHALSEAYRGLLLTGRYPVAFLSIDMPTELVDVNVHPTKSEVRFMDSGRLYSQLLGTLRTKFLATDLTARGQAGSAALAARAAGTERDVRADQRALVGELEQRLAGELQARVRSLAAGEATAPAGDDVPFATAIERPSGGGAARHVDGPSWRGAEDSSMPVAGSEAPAAGEVPSWESPSWQRPLALNRLERPVGLTEGSPTAVERSAGESVGAGMAGGAARVDAAHRAASDAVVSHGVEARPAAEGVAGAREALQVHNRYLVAESPEGMVIIDQHALHERILYEQFRQRVLAGGLESQQLLVPEPVDLNPGEAPRVLEARETLRCLGMTVEPFGGDTVLVSSYPAMLARVRPGELLRSLVEQLLQGGRSPEARDLLDELLHMMACKAAVKAGDRLSPEEIVALLEQRHLVDDAHHCPHGRPTALVFTREDLDKQFLRT